MTLGNRGSQAVTHGLPIDHTNGPVTEDRQVRRVLNMWSRVAVLDSWQGCRVHFEGHVLAEVPKGNCFAVTER